MVILTLIGIIFFPIFTFGCVLIHYDHPGLAIVAFIISLLKGGDKE